MVGGLDYANDLSGWVENAPKDPLDQEAASFHNYMGKACDNVGCWNGEIAPVAADVPVVTGEFAQDVCGPSNFDDEYMDWADAHGVSYLAWAWIVLSAPEIAAEECSAYYLISDYGYTPAAPNGTNLRNHLLALAQSPAPPGSTPPAATMTAEQNATIALKTFHARVEAGGAEVVFELRAAQSCNGSLAGQTTKTFAVGSKGHKRRKVSLGTINFKLVAGKEKSIVLKLSGPARGLLKEKGSLAVRFTVTLSGPGNRTVVYRTATLREPASHRHPA